MMCFRNYLRVRGEYSRSPSKTPYQGELPPRARRILEIVDELAGAAGTTSACAENTLVCLRTTLTCQNYLRVRGEYKWPSPQSAMTPELPPRARRIPCFWMRFGGLLGTTSACAENTHRRLLWAAFSWNYLRVRGEYNCCLISPQDFRELPPRARRILEYPEDCTDEEGTTSACAENTPEQRKRS